MYYVIIYRSYQGASHAERFYGTRAEVAQYRAWCITLGHATSGIREA